MRLHLVTSRKPLAGSVGPADTLVLMDTDTPQAFIEGILAENPPASKSAWLKLEDIGQEKLVTLVTECSSLICW